MDGVRTSRNVRASSAVAKYGRGFRKAVGGVSIGEAAGNAPCRWPAPGVADWCGEAALCGCEEGDINGGRLLTSTSGDDVGADAALSWP